MSGDGRPLWVMFVDNDPVDQMLYERFANRAHSNLRLSSHFYADEALPEIRKDTSKLPDLIILDINIPRMSGMEFMAELAQFDEQVKDQLNVVVASTSINPSEEEAVARFPMVNSVVSKPVGVEQLRTLLNLPPASESPDATESND